MRESKGYKFKFECESEITEFDRKLEEATGFIFEGYIECVRVWKYRNNNRTFDICLGNGGVVAVKIYEDKEVLKFTDTIVHLTVDLIEELNLDNVNNSVEFTNLIINKLK